MSTPKPHATADKPEKVIAICWFRREDYDRAKAAMVDPGRLYADYDEWLKEGQAFEREMQAQGVRVVRIRFDATAFALFCLSRQLPADGVARAAWATEEAMKRSGAAPVRR